MSGTLTMEKKKSIWEVLLQMLIAALTAGLTAVTTTSCMGHGPVGLTAWL